MSEQKPKMPESIEVKVTPAKLPPATLGAAKPLMGFDYGKDIFHLLCFDFGDDGGAIGIWREGDDFCARISLDALAEFWTKAKASAPGGAP